MVTQEQKESTVSLEDNALLESLVSPFVRTDRETRGKWWWHALRVALLPLAVVRVTCTVSLLVVLWLMCCVCGMMGVRPHCHPWLRGTIQRILRVGLCTMGFWRVSVEDMRSEAERGLTRPPLIVSNHTSYLDMLVLIMLFVPSFVSKASIARVPLVGTIARALDCLFVRLDSARGRAAMAGHIVDHARRITPRDPPLCVFPEGTTTNGTALIRFHRGTFRAGLAVQPVVIRYPHRCFNPSWESILVPEHLYCLYTQLYNHVHVQILPAYHPSPQEQRDPDLYAANLRALFADTMHLPTVDVTRRHKLVFHRILRGELTRAQAVAALLC